MTSKNKLQKYISDYKETLKMIEDLKEVSQKFKTHKKLNKRFFDAFESMNEKYSSYVEKYNNFDRVSFRKGADIYFSFAVRGEFTYSVLEKEINENNYLKYIEEYEMKLERFDNEKERLGKILTMLESDEFKCFSMFEAIRAIQKQFED